MLIITRTQVELFEKWVRTFENTASVKKNENLVNFSLHYKGNSKKITGVIKNLCSLSWGAKTEQIQKLVVILWFQRFDDDRL